VVTVVVVEAVVAGAVIDVSATAVVSAALLSPELQAATATRAEIDNSAGRAVRRFMDVLRLVGAFSAPRSSDAPNPSI